jgi:hypothetical protein
MQKVNDELEISRGVWSGGSSIKRVNQKSRNGVAQNHASSKKQCGQHWILILGTNYAVGIELSP